MAIFENFLIFFYLFKYVEFKKDKISVRMVYLTGMGRQEPQRF